MKYLIVGDLHGREPSISYKNFDAIIAPGDFCSDATRSYQFQTLRHFLNTGKTKPWYQFAGGKKKAQAMVEESLRDGRVILEKLNSYGVPVYVIPGNWDWKGDTDSKWAYERTNKWPGLIEGLDNIVDCHHQLVKAQGVSFIGHGWIFGPEYPQQKQDRDRLTPEQKTKKRKSYNSQYRKLKRLFEKSKGKVIFLSHNVPYNTPLDQINNPESPRDGDHFGSIIARRMIEKYNPLTCIGGHMHEHFGECYIKKTVCINAGFGAEVNTLVTIEKGKVKSISRKGKTAV
jgi:Icc-related predicted phosphoesterase